MLTLNVQKNKMMQELFRAFNVAVYRNNLSTSAKIKGNANNKVKLTTVIANNS